MNLSIVVFVLSLLVPAFPMAADQAQAAESKAACCQMHGDHADHGKTAGCCSEMADASACKNCQGSKCADCCKDGECKEGCCKDGKCAGCASAEAACCKKAAPKK